MMRDDTARGCDAKEQTEVETVVVTNICVPYLALNLHDIKQSV